MAAPRSVRLGTQAQRDIHCKLRASTTHERKKVANEWGRADKENECGNQEMQGSRRRKEKGVATRALKREDEERERGG